MGISRKNSFTGRDFQKQRLHSNKLFLMIMVTGALLGTSIMPSYADNYNYGISGNISKDQGRFPGADISGNQNSAVYDFHGRNISISVENTEPTDTSEPVRARRGQDLTINNKGGVLDLHLINRARNSFSGVSAIDAYYKNNITINSDIYASVYSDYMADGISVSGDSNHITINGNVKMRKDDPSNPWGIITNNTHGNYGPGGAVSSSAPNYTGARWQPAAIWNNGKGGSSVTVNGDFDAAVRGTAVSSDPYSFSGNDPYATDVINLNGGNITIETPVSNSESYYALAGYGGTINVNITNGTANPSHDVKMIGNIIATGQNDAPFYVKGRVNMGLASANSYWRGIIDNAGKNIAGDVNIWLKNGAVWYHESQSRTNGLQPENMPSPSNQNHYGKYDGVSYVSHLFGGNSEGTAGYIYQRDPATLDIGNLKGNIIIDYQHTGNGSQDTDYQAGDTVIHSAEDAGVVLSTSNNGISMGNKSQVESALSALAHKLYYLAGDSHLNGKVQIAEGLVSSSASRMVGKLDFTENGKGHYIPDSVKNEGVPVKPDKPDKPTGPDIPVTPDNPDNPEPGDNPVHYGNYETGLMQGAREAFMTSIFSWRDAALDTIHRSDLLRSRMSHDKDGLWGKAYRGKSIYSNHGHIHDNDSRYQVGYDRSYGDSWILGAGIDYVTGHAGYTYGGRGNHDMYSLNLYGSKDLGQQGYLDITGKVGHLKNDYTVYNRDGRRLDGTYNHRAYSLSVKTGKILGSDNLYWEPQAGLTYAYIPAKSFTGTSEGDTLFVHQHSYKGLIGHAGLEVGRQNHHSSLYGRIGIYHDFTGTVKGDYSDGNGNLKSTDNSVKDTWFDLTAGGTVELRPEAKAYIEITKGFGNGYRHDWSVGAGLRMLVGPGQIPAPVPTDKNHSNYSASDTVPAGVSAQNKSEQGQPENHSGKAIEPEKTVAVQTSPAVSSYDRNGEAYETTTTNMALDIRPVSAGNGVVTYEMGPIVVTANRVPQPILEAKADMSVVSRREIEDLHIGNLEESLRTIPGIQFTNYGGNALNGNISGIRINGSQDIVVLVDGVKVTDLKGPGSNGYIYSALLSNPDNIERVEVLRGSASTMYGSGAKGGVINIITRKINKTQTSLDVSKGSFGKENYRFDTQGRKGRFGYNIYHDKTMSGNFKDGGGVKWYGHTNSKAEGAKLSWNFNDDHVMTYSYDTNHSRYHGWDRIYVGPYNGYYNLDTHTVNDEWKLSGHWSNSFTYRHSKEDAAYAKPWGEGDVYGLVKTSPYSDSKKYTYDFVSDHIGYTSKAHSIVMGVDYSKADGYSYNTGSSKFKASHSMKNTSWYIQDDWKILPSVTLSGGIRHDKPSLDTATSHNSKSYKLSWDMTDKDTIYTGRSDYFILPSMDQLYNSDGSDSKLKPASGRTTTIGYNRKFSDNNFFTFNWYDTKAESDIGTAWSGGGSQSIAIDPVTGKPIWKYVNTKNRTLGWNAQYQAQINQRLSARLGWAHMKITSTDTFVDHGYAPKDLITFGVTYDWNKWQFGLDGYYFVRIDSKNNHFYNDDYGNMKAFPSDKYAIFNLSLNYHPGKYTTFYLKVDNLFDKLYAEHTDVSWNPSAGPERWYSLPGRTVLLGMNMRF